jgi:hypothetical protein
LREINACSSPPAAHAQMDIPGGPKLPHHDHAATKLGARRHLSAFGKLALPDTDESAFDERLKRLANARQLKAHAK